MYHTVIKRDGVSDHKGNVGNTRLRLVFSTFLKCSQMSGVFNFNYSVIHSFGFYFRFLIEVIKHKTIKTCFFYVYTLIEHGFLTNQSLCKVLSTLNVFMCTGWSTCIVRKYFGMLLTQNVTL